MRVAVMKTEGENGTSPETRHKTIKEAVIYDARLYRTLYTFFFPKLSALDCLHSTVLIYISTHWNIFVGQCAGNWNRPSILIAIAICTRWMYYSLVVNVPLPHLTLFTSLRCTNKPIYTFPSLNVLPLVSIGSISTAYPPNRLFCVSISGFLIVFCFFFWLYLERRVLRARGQHLLQLFIKE